MGAQPEPESFVCGPCPSFGQNAFTLFGGYLCGFGHFVTPM